jgi:hypothetical protein
MRALLFAGGAVALLITNLAAGAQPVGQAVAYCQFSKGKVTGRGSNPTADAVKCTINCEIVVGNNTETFGCTKTLAPKTPDKRICPLTAKAKGINGPTMGTCTKA